MATKVNNIKRIIMKEKVMEVYKLMIQQNLSELELKEKDFFVRLKRRVRTEKKPLPVEKATESVKNKTVQDTAEMVFIQAPLGGVFYRAPSPKSPPYVNENDIVESGDVLCIIEAMKVMNEIRAEIKSRIVKILVENGKIVTSGQALFLIQPL